MLAASYGFDSPSITATVITVVLGALILFFRWLAGLWPKIAERCNRIANRLWRVSVLVVIIAYWVEWLRYN